MTNSEDTKHDHGCCEGLWTHSLDCANSTDPWAELENESADLDAAYAEIKQVRFLLWIRHGCPIEAAYGDDGELQCNACLVDFKRAPVSELIEPITEQFHALKKASYFI